MSRNDRGNKCSLGAPKKEVLPNGIILIKVRLENPNSVEFWNSNLLLLTQNAILSILRNEN